MIAALQQASTDGNGQMPPAMASGMPESSQRQLGDDAERAFGADHHARQVVAGGGFSLRAAPSSNSPFAITTLSDSTLSFMVP